MKRIRLTLALAALAFTPSLAKADPITYTFNQTVTQDATDYATVTGTVTTDGTLGNITPANITNFDLFVNETAGSQTLSVELSTALALASFTHTYSGVGGNGYFTAAADTLSFDFSQSTYLEFGSYGMGYVVFDSGYEHTFISNIPVFPPESGVQVIASVMPSSVTPEPSSLILLGTGALGVAGAVRRRMVRA